MRTSDCVVLFALFVLYGGAFAGYALVPAQYHGVMFSIFAWVSIAVCVWDTTVWSLRLMPVFLVVTASLCLQLGIYAVYHRI